MRRMLFAEAIALVVCVVSVIAACGDSSNTYNNPVPVLTSVSPNAATVQGDAFTLTVNGSGFVTGSVVEWNGVARATTYVSRVQLTAAIPAADLTSIGIVRVTVFNPRPGGGISSAITLTIQPPTYTLTEFGTFGGESTIGYDINDSGQVTGVSETFGNREAHAFVTIDGVMTDLGTLGGRQSVAVDINDSGQVTGSSGTSGDAGQHAFVTIDGVMTDLGTLGGTDSRGEAINNAGQVTGQFCFYGMDLPPHPVCSAFVTIDGAMTDLGTLGGTISMGYDINDSGQVSGFSRTSADAETHAFVTIDGAMTDLGTLGGTISMGYDINDSGQVSGFSTTSADAETHAFVTIDGVMTDLGTLGGTISIAYDINDSGQVTGYSETLVDFQFPMTTNQRAFVYIGGQMLDLNALVDPNSPLARSVVLIRGVAITDTGYILAWGHYTDDPISGTRAFLLSPASHPAASGPGRSPADPVLYRGADRPTPGARTGPRPEVVVSSAGSADWAAAVATWSSMGFGLSPTRMLDQCLLWVVSGRPFAARQDVRYRPESDSRFTPGKPRAATWRHGAGCST